ncbi:efflux RND transporter periplasmic adaptor subunit [Pseudoalteromonas sp. S3785]|uniref:efflux RND transporter periplasmic adaptor subunit n=1 Tax=Pseudoalteromonas sp. S3785 TaxID=579545 RepID=UPI00110BFFDC|nr:efflux RND transporter periplasmic adaptor subunit [Pseudoalteromonas sp. S3785]TMO76315.1 efflux RND transporter periplasmic adaptor subunit [Pseudoalteromonas sp. S3785]
MKTNLKYLVALLIGAALMFIANRWLINDTEHLATTADSKKAKPLYWVAPMDSNYRRDEPGLSPMGMELVPVYANTENDSPGTIKILPEVVNNLGVKTSKVQVKTLQSNINTIGYVQYNQDQVTHIHPRVEGWIETLFVKAQGEPVSAGEPLYTLYSPELVNAQEEFLLAVNRKNSVLIRAAKARLESLNVSDGFIERLEKNKKVMQNITFYARQSGVLNELNIREGFYVKPGTSMMSIAKLDQVWVEAEVFERQAALVTKGLPVTMTLDYIQGKQWQGVVDYIYPALNTQNRTLRVRLRFENTAGLLKPNMFAQVSIHTHSNSAQLVIPKQALIRTGAQNRVVLALGNGRFKSVAVKVGQISQQEVAILSGITKEDSVVTAAQFLIDSESSKDSDSKRMSASSTQAISNMPDMEMDKAEAVQTATVMGTINNINPGQRVINISREAIAKWNRGPATMDFILAKALDISALSPNQQVHFTFSIIDGEFVISKIAEHSTDKGAAHHSMHGESL